MVLLSPILSIFEDHPRNIVPGPEPTVRGGTVPQIVHFYYLPDISK
jgi:hypothetical protein